MNRQAQKKSRWPAWIGIICLAIAAIIWTYDLVTKWASDTTTTHVILILGVLAEIGLIIVGLVFLRKQKN